jgi:hypothetical protein
MGAVSGTHPPPAELSRRSGQPAACTSASTAIA